MSYKTTIEIGVVGVGQIGLLQKSLNQVATTVDVLNKKQINTGFNVQNLNTYNRLLQEAWQNINKAAMGSTEELQAVRNLVQAKNNQIAAQKRLNALIAEEQSLQNKIVATANAGFGVQGPAAPPDAGESREKARNKRLESIALGVGFPLLFGGGAGEVLGSLAGSFVGTGFGGQIFGGAIGGIIDDFITKAGELGTALNPATANIEELVKALGGSTTAAGAYITQLNDLKLSEEALAVATAELGNLVGTKGVNALRTFGEDSAELQSAFAQAMTQMQASVAELINSTGILKALAEGVNRGVLLRQALQSTDPRQQQLRERRTEAGRPGLLGGNTAEYFKLTDKLIENQREINAAQDEYRTKQREILTADQAKKKLLEETAQLTSASSIDLERALVPMRQQTTLLNTQKVTQQEIKNLIAMQRVELETNTEKYKELTTAVQREMRALDRNTQLAASRYSVEAAQNDLYGARLQRQYELAKTDEERLVIATKMFTQQVNAAYIEYKQTLLNNAALVQKAKLESKVAFIKYKQIEAEKQIAIAQAKARGNSPEQVKEIADAYDKALGAQGEAVEEAYRQVKATEKIAADSNKIADAVYKTKVIQAEGRLAQRLTSAEIGVSTERAEALAGALGRGAYNANQMAGAFSTIAAQANRAAEVVPRLVSTVENRSPVDTKSSTPYEASYKYDDGSTGYAYIKAHYAEGGFVTKPTAAMVGEGGESEYVIPSSKMNAAMARYASGKRGESVIPQAASDTSGSSDYAATINPMINVTTGPVMNMNGSNYVSQRDFIAGMQAASRRGAEMALSAMRNNGTVRRVVGAR